MRVGLVADTHIIDVNEALPSGIADAFRGVDLILHAGDIYIPSVLDELQRIAPVLAAGGDDDYGDMLADHRVKQKHILKLHRQTLWLVHRRPRSLSVSGSRRQSLGQVDYDAPNIVVFGHEHRAVTEYRGNTLFINPGSPTFPSYQRRLGTVGILDIDTSKAQAHILEL